MADQKFNTIPNSSQEIWKPVPGFPAYDISTFGRVRSYWRLIFFGNGGGCRSIVESSPQKVLYPSLDSDGYPKVTLMRNGNRYSRTVHKLVLTTFVGPRPPGMEACHGDGIRTNCFLSNLRWDTSLNNGLDMRKHGNNLTGNKNHNTKLMEYQVYKIRELASQHAYSLKTIAEMFGVHKSTVNDICQRRIWTHLP